MDEAGFQAAASLVTPQAPKLPDGLDQEQATSGREGGESKILAAVAAAKQGAK
jgi:hypothetical protein